jgi:hypothetical protein
MAAEMALKREQMQLDVQARHGSPEANAGMAGASTVAPSGIDGVRMGGEVG